MFISRRPSSRAFRVSFFILALTAFTQWASAAVVSWSNPAGGDWATAGNWITGTVPTAADDVHIDMAGTYTVSISASVTSVTVNSLTLGGASGTQTLTTVKPLTLNAPSTVGSNGVLTANSTVNGAGTLSVVGVFNLNGYLSGTGAKTIASGGTLNLQNGAQIAATTLNIDGLMEWASTNTIDVSQGAIINIDSGGVFDIQNDYNVYIFGGTPNPTWNNAGIIRKTAGSAVTGLGAGTLNNTGSVQAHAATLQFSGGGTSSGNFDTAAGASLNFSSNTFTLNTGTTFTGAGFGGTTGGILTLAGTVNAQNLKMTGGTINGTGTLTVTNTFNHTGGYLSGSGVILNIPTGAVWNVNTANVAAATCNIDGSIVWTGTSALDFSQGAIINIHATGLFDAQSDAPIYIFGGGNPPVFNNAGTMRKSAGTGTSAFGVGFLNNIGFVKALTGTVEFSGGGNTTGNFDAAAGSTINLRSGTFTLNTGTTFTGAGFSGTTGTVSLAGSVTAQNFQQTGGSITGTGTFTVTNTFNDNSGSLNGSGAVLDIAPGAVWNMDTIFIAAATVNNAGTMVWKGTHALDISQGATINNSGLFLIRNDLNVYIFGGGASPVWNNTGIVRKELSYGETGLGVGAFNNSGTVQTLAGHIKFATFTNDGTVDLISGYILTNSFVQHPAGKVLIKIAGRRPQLDFGQVVVNGPATLAGTLTITMLNGFVPYLLDSFAACTYTSHTGTFSTINGLTLPSGESLFAVYGSTNLTLSVSHAQLAVTGSGSPDPVLTSNPLTYSITVTNKGPLTATGIVVTDILPTGASLTNASSSQGACSGSGPVTCNVGTLASGAGATLTVAVSSPATNGTIKNTVSATLNEPEPFQSEATTNIYNACVTSASDVALTGIAPANPHNGDVRTLTLTGVNFAQGATVTLNRGLRGEPDPGPILGVVTATTSTSITVDCDLTSNDVVGEWDVIVQNPGGATSSRPILILPTLLYPYSTLTGTPSIPIGAFRPNYIETLGGGNDDGIAMFEITPPDPGTILLKIGPPGAPIWDSSTVADPGKAVILQPLTAGQMSLLTMNWMIPAANVAFSSEPPLEPSLVRAEGNPIQVKIGDTRIIVWEGREIAKGKLIDFVKDALVSTSTCTSVGLSLAGVTDANLRSAIKTSIESMSKKGSTVDALLQKVGETLGGQIPGFDKVKYAADVGNCIGTILQTMQAAYQAEVKKVADNLRRRANGDINKADELALDEILTRQGGRNGIAGSQHVIDLREQLLKPPCNKPGVAARNATKVQLRGPWDPNDKTTRAAAPCQRSSPTSQICVQYFSGPFDPIEYTIEFQNKATATAPATNVVITDTLDGNLSATTLQVLSNSSPSTFTYQVSGQTVTFTFTGINLPPDTNPPDGEGFVRFSVKPVSTVAIGTIIDNTASIVFDSNPPINTPTVQYVISSDVDGDGVLDMIEDAGPNGGDANGDGIPDRLQPNVTTLPLISGGGYITLVTSGGCSQNQKVQHIVEAGLNQPDTGYAFPAGLVSFALPCTSATVTIFYHSLTSLTGGTVRRFGPATPGDASTVNWYTQPGAVFGTANVGGVSVPTMTFSLTDGGPGDDTPADGLIVGVAGAAMPSSALSFSTTGYTISSFSGGTATITVNRADNATGAVSVAYSTAGGSAVAGTDYTAASGTLTWADGDLAPKTFSVFVFKATTIGDKTVGLLLSNPTGGAALALPNQAVLSLVGGVKGDANGDGSVTVSDVFYLVNYLFANGPSPVGPSDVNGDGIVSVADIFYLINYLFGGGPAPR
jgi:uncharacterized repeat protein (TIGR01451 family)